MKTLLILLAIGLTRCEKLDRTYLPPEGSASAGGYPKDLNLPLEYPKEKYPSNSKSGRDRTTDSSISSKFPNIALGIDRQGPFVTALPKFTEQPEVFVSNKIYNIPTTTPSNDFSETSTFSPVKTYYTTGAPDVTASQGYSSPFSSFDPNLSYDQYLIQQNLKPNKTSQLTASFISRDPISPLPSGHSDIQDEYYKYLQPNPFIDININEYVSEKSKKIGAPEFQVANIPTLTPQTFFKTKYPKGRYGGDLDSILGITIPSANTQGSYTTQRIPIDSNTKTETLPTRIPEQNSDVKLVINTAEPSSKYPPNSGSNNINMNYKNIQPQRVQTEKDRSAVILNYENILTPEGFAYSFDTSNGIHADENGTAVNGVRAQGSYSFIGDDGKLYTIEYTADENGFLPRGDHLPTAPPIPDAILRTLEQDKKKNILGIFDDGSYDDGKYGHRRYQGIMDRIPQNQYNNIIKTQPSGGKNIQDGNISKFLNELPTFDLNNGDLDDIMASNAPTKLSDTSNLYKPDAYKKDSYEFDDNKDLPTVSSANQEDENRMFISKLPNVNKKLTNPRQQFRGNILDSNFHNSNAMTPNSAKKSKIFDSINFANISPKENVPQDEYHTGYKYSVPQNRLNINNQYNLHSSFPSIRKNDESSIDGSITDEKFTVPNTSLNYRNQKPITSTPILRKTFNNPTSEYGKNRVTKPDTPLFYNRESGKFLNEETTTPKTEVSTRLPFSSTTTTASTTSPSYEPPYASNVNLEQSKIYPSSTFGLQSSMSLTPRPSVTTTITPPKGNLGYSVSTPSKVTSTFMSSITSRPTAGTTSSLSGFSSRTPGSEEIERTRIKPDVFGQKIFGRPGSKGRPYKTPITKSGFSDDIGTDFGVLTDQESQNKEPEVLLRPGDGSNQSVTEKIIGEDFSGPKQSQRFDPKYGYYY